MILYILVVLGVLPPRVPLGRLEVSREPFWGRLGTILDQFPSHFEAMFASTLFFSQLSLPACCCRSCCFAVPDAQGRRVPALALTISLKLHSLAGAGVGWAAATPES